MKKRMERAIANLRAKASKSTLDLDAALFVRALKGESDRGSIILGATMIDDRLVHELGKLAASAETLPDGFRKRMNHSFASRVELARGVGLVTSESADMIEVIREMRNACAHGREKLAFRSPVIVEALDSLLAHGGGTLQSCNPGARRDVFVVVCAILAATVSGGLSPASFATIEPIFVSVTGSMPKWVRKRA